MNWNTSKAPQQKILREQVLRNYRKRNLPPNSTALLEVLSLSKLTVQMLALKKHLHNTANPPDRLSRWSTWAKKARHWCHRTGITCAPQHPESYTYVPCFHALGLSLGIHKQLGIVFSRMHAVFPSRIVSWLCTYDEELGFKSGHRLAPTKHRIAKDSK